MCIYIYIYTCTPAHTHIYIYIYIHTDTDTDTDTDTHAHAHTQTRTHTHTHIHTHAHTHTHTHTRTHTRTFIIKHKHFLHLAAIVDKGKVRARRQIVRHPTPFLFLSFFLQVSSFLGVDLRGRSKTERRVVGACWWHWAAMKRAAASRPWAHAAVPCAIDFAPCVLVYMLVSGCVGLAVVLAVCHYAFKCVTRGITHSMWLYSFQCVTLGCGACLLCCVTLRIQMCDTWHHSFNVALLIQMCDIRLWCLPLVTNAAPRAAGDSTAIARQEKTSAQRNNGRHSLAYIHVYIHTAQLCIHTMYTFHIDHAQLCIHTCIYPHGIALHTYMYTSTWYSSI